MLVHVFMENTKAFQVDRALMNKIKNVLYFIKLPIEHSKLRAQAEGSPSMPKPTNHHMPRPRIPGIGPDYPHPSHQTIGLHHDGPKGRQF